MDRKNTVESAALCGRLVVYEDVDDTQVCGGEKGREGYLALEKEK